MIKSVFGIVVQEDGSFLMVKRRDIPIWVFPGGGIETGETAQEACIRELKEETGLTCKIIQKVGDYNHKWLIPVKASVFLCRAASGMTQITKETTGIEYFSLNSPPEPFLALFQEFYEHSQNLRPNTAPLLKSVNAKSALHFLVNHPAITFRFLLTLCGIHWN